MLTSTVEITWDFLDPLFLGSDASSDRVFAQFDLALGGRGYMIDWLDESLSGPSSIPMLAQQQDNGERPGERSLSREDLWPRTFTSFHHGAGQRWADRSDSDPFRFRTSKGVDVWTRDRVTLLPDVTQIVSSATIAEMVGMPFYGVRAWLSYVDGTTWKIAGWDANDTLNAGVSGSTGITISYANWTTGDNPQLAHDGFNFYAIDNGSASIRKSANGILATTLFGSVGSGNAYCLGYAHGRLLAGGGSGGRTLFDMTTGTSVTVAILTNLGESFRCFAEGQKVIYAATQSAGVYQAKIYRVGFDPTTAALTAPVSAGELPVGEQILTIYGYLGFLFIGSTLGFRMARQSAEGDLDVGPLIPIAGGVRSFAANGQYVYFGWSNFDSATSGIGRIDIATFTDADLVPAYASDLMGTATGATVGLTTVDNFNSSVNAPRVYFAVTGTGGGIYVQHPTDYVASGTLDTGLFGFDLSADKDLMAVDLHTEPLDGSVAVSVSAGEGAFNSVDLHSTSGSVGMFMPTRHIPGDRFEIRLTLARGSTTTAPVVTSTSALAWPAPQRGRQGILPLLLYSETLDATGYPMEIDIWDQIAFIGNLVVPGIAPTQLQLGSESFLVHITDYQTVSVKKSDKGGLQATVRVQWKNLDRSLT